MSHSKSSNSARHVLSVCNLCMYASIFGGLRGGMSGYESLHVIGNDNSVPLSVPQSETEALQDRADDGVPME